jgi:serine protease AprX
VIDSGIAPVKGLDGAGKVVNGPDLSFESQATNLRYVDTFGHGTHLAGIIAGRDATQTHHVLHRHGTGRDPRQHEGGDRGRGGRRVPDHRRDRLGGHPPQTILG